MGRLKTLRSEKGFDEFIALDSAVVVVHHYTCPSCDIYQTRFRHLLDAHPELPLARIHMTLDWVIEKAGLTGDVQEENVFLRDRYGIGEEFPMTLFFSNGQLLKAEKGIISQMRFFGFLESLYSLRFDSTQ